MRLKSLLRLLAFGWLIMFSGQGMAQTAGSIVINEIMASNAGVVISPAYNFDSWIELYNPTDKPVNLSGMYLSDDANKLTRWQMPENIGTIPAKGFLVVWLGSDDIKNNQAPFKLDCDGGTIYVSDANGKLIVSQSYPKALSRTAWARKTDGGSEWSWTASPTPGATNATSVFATERLDAPVVSVGSRIFTNNLRINVEIPAGTKLMYTTDGSVPTPPQATTSQTDTGDDESNEPTWINWIINGDCEGNDATCFGSKDGDNPDKTYYAITDGVGVNGSRGIKIHSVDNPEHAWDTQFFVYTPGHVWQAGEKYRFRMKVRADKPAYISVQTQKKPGDYIYWEMLKGGYNITTDWNEIKYEGTITEEQVRANGSGEICPLQTIAFQLNESAEENNYYFDDIVWESLEGSNTSTDYEITVRDNPGQESTTGRFTVSETTNYVFRLFKDGYLPSVPVTRSYIKTDKQYTIPVVSIVGDTQFFTDPKIGLDCDGDGTNGKPGNGQDYPRNYNMPWDRPVNFSYIGTDGKMLHNQDVNLSVSGGWTRSQRFRSFKLKSNKIFDDQNHLDYPFFPQKPYIRSKVLLVRNGGNDIWVHNARFQDPALETIIQRSGIDLDVQSYVPIIEYVNGELRGVLNLREPNNDKFAYANWGYDDEELDAFENLLIKKGDDKVINRIFELGANINATGAYDELKTLLDIDEYTNYMAVTMFLDNDDWPDNNIKGYRSRNDGRYRFVSFDLDYAFAMRGDNTFNDNPFTYFNTFKDNGNQNQEFVQFFLNMLNHDEFRRKYIDTFCLVAGSVFDPSHANKIIDELLDKVKDMCELMKSQEGIWDGNDPEKAADDIKSKLNGRSDVQTSNMKRFEPMKLSGVTRQAVTLKSDTEGAHITINGIDVPYADFNGYLFQPIRLEAKAPTGYRFAGWTAGAGAASNCLIANTDTWKYYDQGEPASNWNTNSFNDNAWASGQAPLGYTMTGVTTNVSYGSDSNNKNPTTYFRKTVSLSSAPTNNDQFLFNYKIDDGFVVYVNGQEAGRFNMPNGSIDFNSFSSSYAEGTPLEGTLELSPSLFKSGKNVIAVEVHNISYTSSDLFWAAELYTSVGTASEGFVSTESVMDLPTGSTVNLTASFMKLSEEELVAQSITPLRVNEVSADNSIYVNESFKHKDWFELYNTTDTELDIAGLYLSDDENNPLKYQIPASNGVIPTIIPAGGHRIIWADEMEPITQLHTNFKLKNDDDQMVLICSSDEFVANNAAFFDKHPEMKSFADGITYVAHHGDQTVGRYPDGGTSIYKMYRPTIEQSNAYTSADSYLGEDTGMTDPDQNEFTLALAEGWNWMSHPMAEPIATSKLSDYTNRVVGSDCEAIRDQKSGMVGTLKELETGNLYKVQMQQADTYTSKGQFCEDGRPIMLQPGWNWIGYTVNGAQTLSAALSDFLAEDGEKIISHDQSAFATYENGSWQGSLTSLETGMGYMFYTKQAKTLTFKSPSVKVNFSRLHRASHNRASRSRTRSPFKPVSKNAYPNVMGVIAEVWQNKEKTENDRFTLLAYDPNDECRGEGKWINGLAWLTLYGKGGEPLTYRAIDQWDGTVYNIRETMSFTEGVTGSVGQPCIFTIGEKTGEVNAIDNIPATPSSDIVGYYNLDGTRISATTNRHGIYLVKYNNGSYKKIIVK